MTKYQVSDDQVVETITAENMTAAKEQATEMWQAGSWEGGKALVDVRLIEIDEDGEEVGQHEYIEVEVGEDPEAPECNNEEGHDWQSPYEVVGGIKENPGVWSRGGTTIAYKECCSHCGAYKIEVRYGVQRNPGQCDTVEYREADETSLAWAGILADDE